MTKKNNLMLILIAVALIVLPMALLNSEFAGSDSIAEEVITQIAPKYTPWFNSIFEPSGPEVESFLFALQASLGALVVGYIFGFYKGKNHDKSKA